MGLTAAAVVVAAGVLASQQVVGEGAEDDVAGGIPLPDSEPPEPERRRQPGADQPPVDQQATEVPRCIRDGVEVPDCPRLLRTGVEGWNALGGVMLDTGIDHVEAIDLRTGRTRWRLDDVLGPAHQAVPVDDDLVLLGRNSLLRVSPDGQERWVVDLPAMASGGLSPPAPGSDLLILPVDGGIEARSLESGELAWSAAFPEDLGRQWGHVVGRTDEGILVFDLAVGDGSTATVAALDEATGAWVWTLPVEPSRQTNAVAVSGDVVVTYSYVVDESTGEISSDGAMTARDVRTGAPRWELEADEDVGFGGVMLVDDGRLIVLSGPDGIQARDVVSGEIAWQADGGHVIHRVGRNPWAARMAGVPDTVPVAVLRDGRVDRLDPATGEVVWSVDIGRGVEWGVATEDRLFLHQLLSDAWTTAVHDPADGVELVRVEVPQPDDGMGLNLVSLDPLVFLDDGRLLGVPDEVLERPAS